MIKIYSSDEINFSNNGLGILKDILSCVVTEELNGRYDLELEYISNGQNSEYIVENNILKVPVIGKSEQLFRIKIIRKDIKTIKATAYHITYDLSGNFLYDVAPTNQSCAGAMNWILDRTSDEHNFESMSDISKITSTRYVRKNVIEAILGESNSILKVWCGELDRDNFTMKILTRVGQDRGLKILYGKNLREIKWQIDTTEVVTKVLPQGRDELILPEIYIESEFINNYPNPIVKKIDFSDIGVDLESEPQITLEVAYQMLRDAVNKLYEEGLDKPKITIEIDILELSKTEQYKELYGAFETIYIGDTVSAYVPKINIDVKLRIISIQYNAIANKIEKLTIGQPIVNYFSKQNSQIENELNVIRNDNIPSALEIAKSNATQQINSALGGYVYKTNSELFIMDTNNPLTAQRIWRWNINGLGYSNTGINGTYNTAITQDGEIVADFITAGLLDGSMIKANSIKANQLTVEAKNELNSYLHNNTVTIDDEGIEVSNTLSETVTKINNEEFAIYNNNSKIMSINKDTTTLKRTSIEADLTVGNIKQIVRTNGIDIVYVE